jgi:hypothetical protein
VLPSLFLIALPANSPRDPVELVELPCVTLDPANDPR